MSATNQDSVQKPVIMMVDLRQITRMPSPLRLVFLGRLAEQQSLGWMLWRNASKRRRQSMSGYVKSWSKRSTQGRDPDGRRHGKR